MSSRQSKIIVKNTLLLYIRMGVTLIISLYTSRAFLHLLGVEDYGIYNVVGGFVSVLSILSGSLASASQRFITYALGENNEIKLKNIFKTFVTLYLITALIIFILGEVFGLFFMEKILDLPETRIGAAYFVFHCSLITFCFNLLSIPYKAEIIAHEKMNFYALISIIEAFFKLLIVYFLVISTFDKLKLYAALLCLYAIIDRIVSMIYCRKKFEEVTGKLGLDKGIIKEVLGYSVWVTIGTSSAVLKEQGVNIIINVFFGVALNAARGLSMQIYNVANQFATNISVAIRPQITKSFAANDIDRATRLTYLLTKSQGIILLLISMPIILETDFILDIWLKDVPYYAVIFTRWALILCIARAVNSSIVPILLATGKVRNQQLVGGGVMLLNLPLSWLFLKIGFEPAVTMIIGACIELIVLYITTLFLKQIFNFSVAQYWLKGVLPVIWVALCSFILPYAILLIMEEGFFRLIVISLLSIVSVIFFTYFVAMNNKEKKMCIQMIKSRIPFLLRKNENF